MTFSSIFLYLIIKGLLKDSKLINRIHTSFFLIFFFLYPASVSFSMSTDDVEREVFKLFEQFEPIPGVRVTPAEEDRFVIELTFSIGDRWGREGYARDLAKTAITKVFKSNLPLAQGIVKVHCTHIEAIHLALGMNQAKQMSWADNLGPSAFFDALRSCFHWGKSPEDRTYFIEYRPIVKPSPVVSLPPHS
ncbi:MAG: hypothetical protein A2W09_08255 [Deltaproteobacteria bacterium RBG_16_50_11]|nr:MAG: hypothetical protein A2W09_08255 [Deltaproteobacteria bacterium RBG_16_50_11]